MAKSVIITGASRGIGRACALEFAKNGYQVLVCYRRSADDAADVCRAVSAAGGRALPFQMEVADLSDCSDGNNIGWSGDHPRSDA